MFKKHTKKKYLCAEFSESLFIQIGLFIDSGFVPKLKTRKHSTHENEDNRTLLFSFSVTAYTGGYNKMITICAVKP